MQRNGYLGSFAIALACTAGCTNTEMSQLSAYGSNFNVKLWSGGQCVREWQSNGKVLTEGHSDGWFFTDAKTGKLVRVSGCVTVEQQ